MGSSEFFYFFLFMLPMTARWWCTWQITKPAVYPMASQYHTDLYCIELCVSLCLCTALELFWESCSLSDKIIWMSHVFSSHSPKMECFQNLGLLFLLFYPRKSWAVPSNDEYIPIQLTGTQNRSLPEKNKWKHSYKSQANHISDTRKHIKTS